MTLTGDPAFAVFAACAAILVIKMAVVAHYTGISRYTKKSFMNPEDSKVFLKGEGLVERDHPDVDRALRSHRNDLENIPPFLILGLIYLQIGFSPELAKALFITFTVARVLFSIAYFKKWAPWRSIIFTVGELCTLTMVVQILIWAVRS